MSANAKVAEVLYEIGEILNIKGDRFRTRAFNMAAQRVTALTEDIRDISRRGELEEIPSVGKSIAAIIEEVLETGGSSQLEELRESLPRGVRELMELEGVGPKKAMRFQRELEVASIDDLEAAIKAGKLRGLKGFGEKTEANLLRSIEEHRMMQGRFLLGAVLPVIDDIVEYMAGSDSVLEVEVAGSARRSKETVGDLDLLVASKDSERVVEHFVSMPPIIRVLSQGSTKSTVVLEKNLQVDLRVIQPQEYGAALQYFTGSKEHNVKLRTIAVKMGYKLNEYGLFDRDSDARVAGETEEEIYRALGMSPIPPELRENRGEIEAAMVDGLPKLVTLDEIRGDLHVHTKWSDGIGTIEEMASGAMEQGWEYMAICDHTKSLTIANGLDEDRLIEQMDEIDGVNRELEGFTVLKGVECDIKSNGSLDLPDFVLSDLDFVIASVHSAFRMSEEEMTERVITAMHNPHVSAIGHPTGRLIQRRSPISIKMDRLFEAAADQEVMMEINAFPDRLDLDDVNCRTAMERGITMSIGTDAHAPNQLDFMAMGVSVARRGWLEPRNVVNTLSLEKMRSVLKRS
ncbi:MAG: DNA polymerase/3'-5' exonuclease PolX [Candidatus Bathyarchaeota archaeon]|nr:MAG: DNA polymerase/3'-5' exonuclease PolX [Candidatus Bathyarchaeota archaeon]